MKYRPIPLIILSCFLLGCAISIPIQIAVLYNHGITELPQLGLKISLTNWIFIALCVTNAILLLDASALLKFTTPLLFAVTAWNNWFVSEYGQDFGTQTTLLATLGFIGFHGVLLHGKTLKVLVNPRDRWWRIPERKQIPIDVTLFPFRGPHLKLQVYDISEGGTFIAEKSLTEAVLKEKAESLENKLNKPSDFNVGERVQLKFKLGQLHMVSCTAKIVRKADARGNYPAGYGLCFEDMDKKAQKVLKNHINKTPEMGNLWNMATP